MGGADNYSEDRKQQGKLVKSYFDVLGICCSSEIPLIEKILNPLQGVSQVYVIVPSRTVIVLHDSLLISQLQIVNALNKARLEANVQVRGEKNKEKKNRWPSPYAIVSGLLLLLTLILQPIYHPLRYLALGAVAVGILPILLKGLVSLRNFNLDINILVVLAVGGSIALKDYWEAGTIVFLFTIAEWLESKASHRATAAMSSLANIVPQTAVIAETGEQVNADQVKLNTILAVKPGDIIPIDGIVVQGNCDVDEKTLTGESFPVSKQTDSTVWAGTINLNGYVSVKTTALAEDCVVARMANLVEEAQNNKSKTQRLIDRCAKYYTPIIVAISGCLAIIPPAVGAHHLSEWYHLALVVLVSACPCALILSTPVATFCALSNAATSGLLVKGAEHLETLAKVKIMAFDKTGTLTKGEFVVAEFKPLLQVDDINFSRLLHWVASIESKSSHPMAAALVEYAQSYSVEPNLDEVEEFRNFPGEGIYGKIEGKDIYIGNKKIANRAGCKTLPIIGDDAMEGKSIGYIFSGSYPAGVFSLSDVCRMGAKEAINELKSMGIRTAMLTGDCHAAAKHAQDQIGGVLELVHSELLPEDKARIIKEFQNESATAMIGDGLNDAAALATADIGISMGISGSALAMETGNIVLMSNDIRKIPKATRLARRTRWKIIQNIFLSVISKTAVIALAIAGHPVVWLAVLADVGTCLLVIFNSMLLLGRDAKHGKKWCKFSGTGHGHKHCSKTAHSHSAHVHKHCCPGTETVKKHTPKKCSSQKCSPDSHSESPISATHGIEKNTVSTEIHGCCGHNDHQNREVQHNAVTSESKSHVHQHCCSGDQVETICMPQHSQSPKYQCESPSTKPCEDIKPCHKSIVSHGCCEHDDDIVEEDKHMDHCSHGCCKHDDDDILEEDKHMDHFSHGCCERKDKFEQKHVDHGSHNCCEHNYKLEEEKHMDHGSNNCCEHNHKLEEENHVDHGSCGEEKCMDSVEKGHGHCETNLCHHPGSGTTNHQHVNNHRSVSPSNSSEHMIIISNNHCHTKHCGNEHTRDYITEDALSSMVKSCCSHHFSDRDSCASKNVVCSSLKRRHAGRCCNSLRKECCGRSPLFGAGGLTRSTSSRVASSRFVINSKDEGYESSNDFSEE